MQLGFGQQAHQQAYEQVKNRDTNAIEMDAEQVARNEHQAYDPATHDFFWNDDYTTVTIVPLTWWNDASYVAYQAIDGEAERLHRLDEPEYDLSNWVAPVADPSPVDTCPDDYPF